MVERDEGRKNKKIWRAGERFEEGEMVIRKRKRQFSESVWVDNECNLHLDDIRLCGHP